jgi:DNA-directed RNA polymerase specialized sigma24 family protein
MSIGEEMANHQPELGPRGNGSLAGRATGGRGVSSDSQLVQRAVARAKEGNLEALHFLYIRYVPDVLRYAGGFVQDHHEAEDITQGVFAKLVTTISQYEQREAPFLAWILRVARNAALDRVPARRTIPTEEVRVSDVGEDADELRAH